MLSRNFFYFIGKGFRKCQSSSKLVNDDTMERTALRTEKIKIQPDNIRRECGRRFFESKEKK